MGLVALVLAATFLHAEGVLAKTFVVSNTGINCYPSVAGPLYPTIQAAVNAVPIATSATHVVMVCPGTYPEQIKITKNVTITGVLRDGTDPVEIAGNSGEARIVPPRGRPGRDPDFLGNVAAQVSAQNITDLNLTNLRHRWQPVSGARWGADGAPLATAGIALYNVGVTDTTHKATISKSVVHNQIGFCTAALERSYTGEGILAENSWTTIDSNSLSNVDHNLIHQIGGISKITNNWLNLGYHGIMLSNVSETGRCVPHGFDRLVKHRDQLLGRHLSRWVVERPGLAEHPHELDRGCDCADRSGFGQSGHVEQDHRRLRMGSS